MSGLFGGGSAPQINFTPQGFSGGGLNFTPGGKLTQSPQLTQSVGGLQSTFGQAAGAFQTLGNTVAPGFSQLRQAGLAQLQSGKEATLSNLRDSLAQRRVLGSSFASDAISRASAQYDQARADFAAQAYLSEFEASTKAAQLQYQAATQAFATGINQMNFESSLAAQLTAQNNQIGASIATANAQLQMQQQQTNLGILGGIGSLAGTILTAPIAGPLTGGSLIGNFLAGK